MKKIILALLILIPVFAFSQSEIKNNWILNINANRVAWHASGDTIMKWRNDSILFYKPTNISGGGSFTLANGSGTTASGSSVNFGGALTGTASITGNHVLNLGTFLDSLSSINAYVKSGITLATAGDAGLYGNNQASLYSNTQSIVFAPLVNIYATDSLMLGGLSSTAGAYPSLVIGPSGRVFYKTITGGSVDTGRANAQVVTGYSLNKVRDSVQANIDTKQPLDADLTSIAALSTTSYGRALLVEANATSLKTNISLENVDNTSDATKNSATATLTNKTLTAPVINSPTGIVKGDVGLGNVDNTSDATKNSASATLTNKTITSPVINTGVSGSAIDDDITLAANSSTLLPTQHAVRDYVSKRSGSNYLSSNFTTSSTTAVSTNILFAAEANTNYTVTITGTASKDAAGGVKLAIDAPSGSTIKGFQTGGTSSLSTAMTNSLISTVGTLGSAFATGTSVEVPFVMQFVVHVSSTAGNITLQAASVTSGTTTIYADTKMEWRKSTGL